MAFGSGSATGVARADVEFRAETGKFEADVTQAKRIYLDSVDKMGDASLRMSVQQEKLDRAISRFGPNSLQARQAAVNYRRELNSLQHEQDQVRHSAERSSTALVRSGRGAIAASGAFKGLGNALFFASGAFAGAFGFIYALRSALTKAAEAQVVMGQLEVAVKNSGLAWEDHRRHITNVIEAQSKLTAFDDEDLKRTLAALIIRTEHEPRPPQAC